VVRGFGREVLEPVATGEGIMPAANDLKNYIVEFLTARGWTVWVNNSGAIKKGQYMIRLSPAANGDVIGHDLFGRYVHIEVKIGDDVLSDEQHDRLWQVWQTKHGLSCVATSKKQFEAWYDYVVKTK
jgi:hypothetical protein